MKNSALFFVVSILAAANLSSLPDHGVEAGADVSAANQWGRTALSEAERRNERAMAEYLRGAAR